METNTTSFRILSFKDRVFVGIKCMEEDMVRLKNVPAGIFDKTDSVELCLSPSCSRDDVYQFYVSSHGDQIARHYGDKSKKKIPFAPEWKAAVYYGEDFWSVEMELPMKAFYFTEQAKWQENWLLNIARTHLRRMEERFYSTWCALNRRFIDPQYFAVVEGFPIRDARIEVRFTEMEVLIEKQAAAGYEGTLTATAYCAVPGDYTFLTDHSQPVTVTMQAGENVFSVPCCFEERTRYQLAIELTRLADGFVFRCGYPVLVTYEPIKLQFTLPEYRDNFYPGQDSGKISGTVSAEKTVTLTLEGPGIPRQTATPDAEGRFLFETPDFEVGDAIFTASIEGYTLTRKIRKLAPTDHMMTWISGGNLIVNGAPVLRRNMYAEYYCGGEAFKRKYDADNLHQTEGLCGQFGSLEPGHLIKDAEAPGGEATKDAKPTEEMLRKIDEVLEYNRDKDFAFYYISDEPECRELSKIYLEHFYNYVAEKDPYHVVLTATRKPAEFVTIADWFETHPYINPFTDEDGNRKYCRKLSSVCGFVDSLVSLNRPDKCIGFMPTCFASKIKDLEPYPTFDELLCHSWAPMIHGAKTIWPYAYHDLNDRAALYEGIRYLFSSMEALDRFLLFGERTPLISTPEVDGVLYTLKRDQVFVLVNMTNEIQRVTLERISGTWHEFRRNRLITDNTFELKPLEVVIGIDTGRIEDEGLPTYDETVALIAEKEYARTHRGSLFFEHQKDIPVATSGYNGWMFKIFDGVQDNYAWKQTGPMEKFAELDLTIVKPTFSKLVVHGFQIDDLELTVQNGEEVSVPAIAEKKTEEFSTTFLFEAPICPDKLRLTFKSERVELYEIEAF